MAARIPGVTLLGDVADAVGRHGLGVAVEDPGIQQRRILAFDPQTSDLLEERETMRAGNGLGWPAGVTSGRTTYVAKEVVTSNTEVPPAD